MKKILIILLLSGILPAAQAQKRVKTYGQPQPHGNSKTKKEQSVRGQRAANEQMGRNGPAITAPADSQKANGKTSGKRK